MRLNLRQAITSAMVGGIAAALASLVLHHGVFGASQFTFAAILGLAIGASRLVEIGKKR